MTLGGEYQYRVDEGAWTDWLTGTTATPAGFAGELGHVYHFRVRTWDRVGNERPYPAAPDTTTRIRAPVTKYYYASGQRIAMRQGDVYYIHTDHLGSTSVLSDRADPLPPVFRGVVPRGTGVPEVGSCRPADFLRQPGV